MKSEKIIRIGKLVYARLFDTSGTNNKSRYICFKDERGEHDCVRLFWRFYRVMGLDETD
jgi:hypothetical protein